MHRREDPAPKCTLLKNCDVDIYGSLIHIGKIWFLPGSVSDPRFMALHYEGPYL
jgi:hypothetical protein